MRTVKIQYGIFGGELQGKRLRREIQKAGYAVTKNASAADIILAHSAGCFWLPSAPARQKLLLVDPPYWPAKSIGERGKARSKRNFQFRQYGYSMRYWLIRNLWGMYYGVRDFRRTIRIVRHAPQYDLPSILQGHDAVLVRNEHDDWLTSDLADLQRRNPKLRIVHLPGDHDDISHHPERYADLLQLFTD